MKEWFNALLMALRIRRDPDPELTKFKREVNRVLRAFPAVYFAMHFDREQHGRTVLRCFLLNYPTSIQAHDNLAAFLDNVHVTLSVLDNRERYCIARDTSYLP